MNRAGFCGAGLLLLSLAGWWVDPRMFLAAWLIAWWWCLGVVLGCYANGWIHRLSGGQWGAPIRTAASALRPCMPWLLLAGVPVLLGANTLYPWAGGDGWWQGIARPDFLRAWLKVPFFLARMAVYALVWWWLTRPGAFESKRRAAASLVLYVTLTSLAAVDLLMSLMPGWYSTAFALVVLATQALSGAAAAVLCCAWCRPDGWPRGSDAPPVWRDLGNLLLMWSMTWAYLGFMQFLVIWAENLPREIAWYLPRLTTGWSTVGIALVLVQWALPFLALLFRAVKDQPRRLSAVAALLLSATVLDVTWTVLPSVTATSPHGWWLVPLTVAGMALLLFGRMPAALGAEADRVNLHDVKLRHAQS